MIALITNNTKNDKKYDVFIIENNKMKIISFGAKGYEDYTIHHDKKRKHRYEDRHKSENWNDPFTAGFWAKHLLWNKSTIEKSANDIANRYNIDITLAI